MRWMKDDYAMRASLASSFRFVSSTASSTATLHDPIAVCSPNAAGVMTRRKCVGSAPQALLRAAPPEAAVTLVSLAATSFKTLAEALPAAATINTFFSPGAKKRRSRSPHAPEERPPAEVPAGAAPAPAPVEAVPGLATARAAPAPAAAAPAPPAAAAPGSLERYSSTEATLMMQGEASARGGQAAAPVRWQVPLPPLPPLPPPPPRRQQQPEYTSRVSAVRPAAPQRSAAGGVSLVQTFAGLASGALSAEDAAATLQQLLARSG